MEVMYKGKINWRESESCRTYDGSFLYQEKERFRASELVSYGGERIRQSSQEQKFMKTKVRLVKAEKQNPQHQMMFIPTKEYPLEKRLMKQNKRECRMRRGRECLRPSRNQSHLIWQLYQMLIQERIWESYILVGVMVMKKGSVILPVRREYISMKTIINVKTTRHRKIQLLGHIITTDVAQVGKRAVSTANRFGAIWWEPSWIYIHMSMFRESVKKKIEDPKGRLTRLIQYTRGEAKDLIKNFINDRPEYRYNNAMAVFHRQYGNPHTLLSSYRR